MVKIIKGVKFYPISWDYAEHKIETERVRLMNRIDALEGCNVDMSEEGQRWLYSVTGCTVEALRKFWASPADDQAKYLNYLGRVLKRMEEVQDLASARVEVTGYGKLTAWCDGKTYAAVKSICAGYELRAMTRG